MKSTSKNIRYDIAPMKMMRERRSESEKKEKLYRITKNSNNSNNNRSSSTNNSEQPWGKCIQFQPMLKFMQRCHANNFSFDLFLISKIRAGDFFSRYLNSVHMLVMVILCFRKKRRKMDVCVNILNRSAYHRANDSHKFYILLKNGIFFRSFSLYIVLLLI